MMKEAQERRLKALRDVVRGLAADKLPPASEVLAPILDAAIDATGAERGFIVRVDVSGEEPLLDVEIARGFDEEPLQARSENVSQTVVERVLERGHGLVTSNLEDRHVVEATSVRKRRVLSILCVPLRGRTRRVLYLDHRFLKRAFFTLELPLLETFGAHMGRILEALETHHAGTRAVDLANLRRHLDGALDNLQELAEHPSSEDRDDAQDEAVARIVLVDDQPFVRKGLAHLIELEQDLTVVGVADDAPEALKLIDVVKPDLVLIDFSDPETSALELIKDLKLRHPGLPALIISPYTTPLHAERLLRAGAKGYLTKQDPADVVMAGLRKVLGGELTVSEMVADKLLRRLAEGPTEATGSTLDSLSDRELQVFHLIGRGLGTRQIAEELFLSVKTIETYRGNIKRKLQLKSGTELVHHAIRWAQEHGQAT